MATRADLPMPVVLMAQTILNETVDPYIAYRAIGLDATRSVIARKGSGTDDGTSSRPSFQNELGLYREPRLDLEEIEVVADVGDDLAVVEAEHAGTLG